MRYRSGKKTSLLILAVLAENKEYGQYDLPKAVGMDYRTIIRHIRLLEQNDLIRLSRTEPAAKGGKDKKIYALTLTGLTVILNRGYVFNAIDANVIDRIAESHTDLLPLVFGKWRFFETHGLKNEILEKFKNAMKSESFFVETLLNFEERDEKDLQRLLTEIFDKKNVARQLRKARKAHELIISGVAYTQELLIHQINKNVLFEFPPLDSTRYEHFLSVIKRDPDLSNFVDMEFTSLEQQYNSHLKNIRSWRKFWVNL